MLIEIQGAEVRLPIGATPCDFPDPTKIPRRQWLYGTTYIRKFLSLTVSTGGVGKSALAIVEALAMASGKALLHHKPRRTLRVWYHNGEDPREELDRRVGATMRHYGLTPEDVGDRLFVDSGRTMPIVIATGDGRGTAVDATVVQEMIATILEKRIDVVIIDPFVAYHRVSENDNTAMEQVVKAWAQIADAGNCSVMLIHHSRKTGGEAATVDDGRGASALLAAARVARTLNTMTKSEAEATDVDERERRLHFRCDEGKANLARPAEAAEWFKLVPVCLGNAANDIDLDEGDEVGVVTPWQMPREPERRWSAADVGRALAALAGGGPWRKDQRARTWVGFPIAKALDLDLQSKPTKRYVDRLVSGWLQVGYLAEVEGQDGSRKARVFVAPGEAPDN